MLARQLEPEAETTQPAPIVQGRSFEEWLDDLSVGECTWGAVFHGVRDSLIANPDAGWELLALVDQYFRRHKISAEDFHSLNGHVQALLIGGPRKAELRGDLEPRPKPAAPEPRANAAQPRPQPAPRPAPEAHAKPQPALRSHAEPQPPPRAPAEPQPQPKVADIGAARGPRKLVVNEVLRNRYRIRGILAHGGMGTVYAAIDEFRLDQADGGQRVAIKVLHTEVIQRPQLLAELRNEFQQLQALSHPNIVRVHEFDRDADLTFFTMEQLSGAPLSRVLANHKAAHLYRPYAMAIIQQVGGAVAYAHSRGIVHGDLNPGNVFITDQGEIRVLDFGASYRLRHDASMPDPEDVMRTAVATPSYSSCEVLQGGPANPRDDIYAMACVSYVLLTGKHPFQGQNAMQARAARLTPKRPSSISQRQWRALRDGLRFDRQRRPGDMQAWLDELSLPSEGTVLPPLLTIMSAGPHRRGYRGWVTGALIALVAALCWWALDDSDQVTHGANGISTAAGNLWKQIHGDSAATEANAPAPSVTTNAPVAVQPATPAAPPAPAPAVTHAARKAAAVIATDATAAVQPRATVAKAVPVGTETAAVDPQGGAHGPTARIEMAADEVDVDPVNSVATVVVRRRDNYHNLVSFNWWTESGTAKPGQDFVPVKTTIASLANGEHEARLLVPIVADPRRKDSRSFYVVIDEPSDGARLGSRRITMVTIPPED